MPVSVHLPSRVCAAVLSSVFVAAALRPGLVWSCSVCGVKPVRSGTVCVFLTAKSAWTAVVGLSQ